MRWLWMGYGLALLLVVVGMVLLPALNLGWVLLALIVAGIVVPVGAFFLRRGAPDDKFPWE